ncbi:unnamed protein product [Paramecium sonneborni]|uniref:VWFA domain-containing protein n=1 Tax=Paramecium sonneborni TaxID=65129 RepID=A0A8S1Q707_9CILI|nr:unnamed protein product [Paramecium sonneborni]
MMNVWNGGIGQLVCNQLTQKYGKKIQFIKKNQFELTNIHYLIVLDDSGSMGENQGFQRNSILNQHNQIATSQNQSQIPTQQNQSQIPTQQNQSQIPTQQNPSLIPTQQNQSQISKYQNIQLQKQTYQLNPQNSYYRQKMLQLKKQTQIATQQKPSQISTQQILLQSATEQSQFQIAKQKTPFEIAKQGCINCMKDIQTNPLARVSLIIFNSEARVEIDCEEVNVEDQSKRFTYKSGNTCFENAFKEVYNLIQKHSNKNFEKQVILFYTDGQADYPKNAMEQFAALPQEQKQTISLIVCTQDNFPATLSQMVSDLKKSGFQAELQKNVQVEQIELVWTEIIQNGIHIKE